MKTAVVTGGGSGIGRAVTERLRADGHHVATIDLNASDEDFAHVADVTDREQVDAALTAIRDQLGPVAILVNAAGLDGFKRFTDIGFAEWQRVVDVNLNGVFHCIQAALPDMIEAGWGRIVNISSSSTHSGVPYMAHYVAAKSAVNGLTKSLALEYGPAGITVNAVPAGFHRHTDAAWCRGPRPTRRRAGVDRRDTGAPDRQAGGHRGGLRLPGLGGGRLHHRADSRGQRRQEHLSVRGTGALHGGRWRLHADPVRAEPLGRRPSQRSGDRRTRRSRARERLRVNRIPSDTVDGGLCSERHVTSLTTLVIRVVRDGRRVRSAECDVIQNGHVTARATLVQYRPSTAPPGESVDIGGDFPGPAADRRHPDAVRAQRRRRMDALARRASERLTEALLQRRHQSGCRREPTRRSPGR